jgi:hypothetical protein
MKRWESKRKAQAHTGQKLTARKNLFGASRPVSAKRILTKDLTPLSEVLIGSLQRDS